MILSALRQKLLNTPEVTAIVGDRVIVTDVAPENTPYPFINLHAPTYHSTSSLSGRRSGLGRDLVWVHVWAELGEQCEQLFEIVALALQGFRGTVSGVEIQQVLHDQGTRPKAMPDALCYGGHHEFDVMYSEATTL